MLLAGVEMDCHCPIAGGRLSLLLQGIICNRNRKGRIIKGSKFWGGKLKVSGEKEMETEEKLSYLRRKNEISGPF